MKTQTASEAFGITNIGSTLRMAQRQPTQICENPKPEYQILEIVNKFLKEIKAIFPAWWISIKTPEDEKIIKQTYLKAFAENGINSLEKLERGLMMARKETSPFLPSVGKIVAWCNRPPNAEDFGLPTIEKAYLDAVACASKSQNDFEKCNPLIKLLVKKVGKKTFFCQEYDACFAVFSRDYEILLRRLQNGEDVMLEVPKGLPTHEKSSDWMSPETRKVRSAELAKIRKKLGVAA